MNNNLLSILPNLEFLGNGDSKLHMITHCLVAAEAGQPLVLESHYD